MPLVQTRGAASAQGFGEFAQVTAANYIEDVFSCFLYTGTGAALTITNNIDLSTKGGLTWIKGRSGATGHRLTDTARGVTKSLESNSAAAEATESTGLTAFNTTGFTIGADADYNTSSATYVSWTFRKQPKFFDVVTYTGNGTNGRAISHALGSVPGCIMVKSTSNVTDWIVYHRGLSVPTNRAIFLNTTAAESTSPYFPTTPTSTVFYTNGDGYEVNTTGQTYVAYIFAHDAGGFGLTGLDNVISCGSFTTNGSGVATINLGYEPQFVLFKRTDSAGHSWEIIDTMRGFSVNSNGTSGNVQRLNPNSSGAETNSSAFEMYLTSTGFATNQYFYNATYIYIAIRRGPMKVPTTGTSVYNAIVRNGTGANATVTGVGFPVDLDFTSYRPATHNPVWSNRLAGAQRTLSSRGTYAEQTETTALTSFAFMDGVSYGANTSDFFNGFNSATGSYVNWFFKRAPSFFDVVCYTGTGSATTFSHNLQAVPELMIVKRRDTAENWDSYSSALSNTEYVVLNTTDAKATGTTRWNSTTPTSSVFSVGTSTTTNASAGTYVAYLFATCSGVSKVFSYTGNGSSQTINCGFTAGARFVLIKRTDSTGDWYVWDTARGIVAGNDPHLSLNTTAAEVTTDDTIDTDNTGFVVNQLSATDVNVSSATYIGLAVA